MPVGARRNAAARRWLALSLGALLTALSALPLRAQDVQDVPPRHTREPAQRPLLARAQQAGYAFDNPPILLRQQLIGLAHGVRLLGKLCLFEPAYSSAAEQAYGQWHARQAPAIERVMQDLERWYFGSEAVHLDSAVRMRALTRALKLPDELRPLSEIEIASACGSLPAALATARYDFVALLADAATEAGDRAAAPETPAPAPAGEHGAVPPKVSFPAGDNATGAPAAVPETPAPAPAGEHGAVPPKVSFPAGDNATGAPAAVPETPAPAPAGGQGAVPPKVSLSAGDANTAPPVTEQDHD